MKENLSEHTTGAADTLSIVWKVSGFDPEHNDWFWGEITPGGEVRAEGRVEGCMNCHGGARANDFVFIHQF